MMYFVINKVAMVRWCRWLASFRFILARPAAIVPGDARFNTRHRFTFSRYQMSVSIIGAMYRADRMLVTSRRHSLSTLHRATYISCYGFHNFRRFEPPRLTESRWESIDYRINGLIESVELIRLRADETSVNRTAVGARYSLPLFRLATALKYTKFSIGHWSQYHWRAESM